MFQNTAPKTFLGSPNPLRLGQSYPNQQVNRFLEPFSKQHEKKQSSKNTFILGKTEQGFPKEFQNAKKINAVGMFSNAQVQQQTNIFRNNLNFSNPSPQSDRIFGNTNSSKVSPSFNNQIQQAKTGSTIFQPAANSNISGSEQNAKTNQTSILSKKICQCYFYHQPVPDPLQLNFNLQYSIPSNLFFTIGETFLQNNYGSLSKAKQVFQLGIKAFNGSLNNTNKCTINFNHSFTQELQGNVSKIKESIKMKQNQHDPCPMRNGTYFQFSVQNQSKHIFGNQVTSLQKQTTDIFGKPAANTVNSHFQPVFQNQSKKIFGNQVTSLQKQTTDIFGKPAANTVNSHFLPVFQNQSKKIFGNQVTSLQKQTTDIFGKPAANTVNSHFQPVFQNQSKKIFGNQVTSLQKQTTDIFGKPAANTVNSHFLPVFQNQSKKIFGNQVTSLQKQTTDIFGNPCEPQVSDEFVNKAQSTKVQVNLQNYDYYQRSNNPKIDIKHLVKAVKRQHNQSIKQNRIKFLKIQKQKLIKDTSEISESQSQENNQDQLSSSYLINNLSQKEQLQKPIQNKKQKRNLQNLQKINHNIKNPFNSFVRQTQKMDQQVSKIGQKKLSKQKEVGFQGFIKEHDRATKKLQKSYNSKNISIHDQNIESQQAQVKTRQIDKNQNRLQQQ